MRSNPSCAPAAPPWRLSSHRRAITTNRRSSRILKQGASYVGPGRVTSTWRDGVELLERTRPAWRRCDSQPCGARSRWANGSRSGCVDPRGDRSGALGSGQRIEPAAVPVATAPSPAMAIDPVCKMDVDPSTARYRAEVNGTAYYFCCAQCRTRFIDDPARYLSPA